MAKAKRSKSGDPVIRGPVPAEERIARLLALLLVKEIPVKDDKVRHLRAAGFEVSDVANMLNMTNHAVSVADSRGKKKVSG